MDDLSHLPPTAAACVAEQQRDDDILPGIEMSETSQPSQPTPTNSGTRTNILPSSGAGHRKMKMTKVPSKNRSHRTLMPPPRSIFLEKSIASVAEFLRPSSVPVSVSPESLDTSFKPHATLLRKTTLDSFDLNRYLFGYKPLAKVHAVLAATLLSVADIDHKSFPMSPALRSAAMFVAGNAHRSIYTMTYAAQLKGISRSRPPSEGIMGDMVLKGLHLSERESAALDFAQELSWPTAAVSEATRRRLHDADSESNGRLERIITGTSAYAAFVSCLTSVIDVELAHGAVQYAIKHLEGLQWKRGAVNVGFEYDQHDFGAPTSAPSKQHRKRERLSLTRQHERGNRNRSGRTRSRGIRRVSHFFTASLMGPKCITDANKATENWMKTACIPPSGQLFDINDEIYSLFGFHPYYFSTVATENENTRRAFLFGAKELLFGEREIPRRLKFIICYVLSSGKERRRIVDSESSRSFEKPGVHNGHSITSVYSLRTYDSLSIMSAQAAFLACKYGAHPSELIAATDVSRVRSAMERYLQYQDLNLSPHTIGFPLTKRDCAAVLVAHSLLAESPCVEEVELRAFECIFVMPVKGSDQGNRASRRALLEIIGAASMWCALERYATGTLAFDIDFTSNMLFSGSRAEPAIIQFCRSSEGRKIGLSLAAHAGMDDLRGRSNSRASRTTSLRPNAKRGKRVYQKRTSSALNSTSRMARIFSTGNTDLVSEQASTAS